MKKDVYRSEYEAYPFLADDPGDLRCDFEILTDEISAYVGLLRSKVKDESIEKELLTICELIYHINPSIRTFASVTDNELRWLEECTNRLEKEVQGRCDKFVLNQGCENACLSHIIRTKFKKLVRMIYRHIYNENIVPEIILDFANLLSGYFFFLSMKLNEISHIDEIEFESRNY